MIDFVNNQYSEQELRKFVKQGLNNTEWILLSINQRLSESFMRDYFDNLSYGIYGRQKFSKDFLIEMKNKIDVNSIHLQRLLPDELIEEFQNEIDWSNMSRLIARSEDFIRKFQDKINWTGTCEKSTLSEKFIREFQDKVDWVIISHSQVLSDEFCEEFDDKLRQEETWRRTIYWRANNKYHRTIGPAIIYKDNNKFEYWFHGVKTEVLSELFIA